jgi:hypothetical protein
VVFREIKITLLPAEVGVVAGVVEILLTVQMQTVDHLDQDAQHKFLSI